MNLPNIKLMCVANVFSRDMIFERAGDTEQGHTHQFDHASLIAAGSVRLTVNGVSTDYKAPCMAYVKKDLVHKVEALEDNSIAVCIHALRTGQREEDIIDPDSIPAGVDPLRASLSFAQPAWQQKFVVQPTPDL